MAEFKVVSEYSPAGDQPQAIAALAEGVEQGLREQVLMGVTGSGKTYTMAKVIEAVQRPTLVLAHNKTLAAQLCEEFREFFPNNAVEYFVSYYDYYQPEAYIPPTDTLDLRIYCQDASQGESAATYTPINRDAFAYYYKELSSLQAELGLQVGDLIATIMRMPEVPKLQDSSEISDEEWNTVLQTIEQAIVQFNSFRDQEGASLYQMFCEKLDTIGELLVAVEPYEQSRVEKIKARIVANLEQLSAATQQAIDRNRLEQEMIYYLEKLDITEEKVRLYMQTHSLYIDTLVCQCIENTFCKMQSCCRGSDRTSESRIQSLISFKINILRCTIQIWWYRYRTSYFQDFRKRKPAFP